MCIVCANGLQLADGGFVGRSSLEHPEAVTTVSDFRALVTSSWNMGSDFRPVFGRAAFISISFQTSVAAEVIATYGQTYANSFTPLTSAQIAVAWDALRMWGEASGITFFEVPSGSGDIRLGNYDFTTGGPYTPTQASAFAVYPGAGIGGDIFIGRETTTAIGLFLHEIGHALGLKHSFEGDFVLPAELDNYGTTVMSYTSGGNTRNVLGPLDLEAIRYIYGGPDRDGTQISSWNWSAETYTLTQIGSAAGEIIRGIGGNNIIDGGAGDDTISAGRGTNSILGGDGADRITVEAGTNNIDGGAGDDTVRVTWGINSRLTADGGAGNDRLEIAGEYSSATGINLNLSLLGEASSTYINFESVSVTGTRAADTIVLGAGNESVSGFEGDDRLDGAGGNDTLFGGAGNDVLIGGDGNDYLSDDMGGTFILDGGAGTDSAVFSQIVSTAGADWSLAAMLAAGSRMTAIEFVSLVGGSLADRITGSDGVESINGGAGNDILMGLGGSDSLIGGDGVDTAVYAGLRGGYSSVNQTRVAGGREGGSDTLVSVERLRFLDGTISYESGSAVWTQDEATVAVARLYQVCLGRVPDIGGLEHYRLAVDQGYDLNHFTRAMIESPEFIARFGALTNQQFVQQIYRFVLGREGDAGGVATYTSALSQGYTRADVVLVFSESPENKLRYQTTWETQVRTLENGRYPAATPESDAKFELDDAFVLPGADDVDDLLDVASLKDEIMVCLDELALQRISVDGDLLIDRSPGLYPGQHALFEHPIQPEPETFVL